jgi:hypothetical protein
VDELVDHPALSVEQLRHWRLMKGFQQSLKPVLKQYTRGSFADPERLLLLSDYLSLFLFGLFNPSVRTLRGLSEISRLQQVREEVCRRPVSLASFSEAQHLLELGLLEKVFGQLSQRAVAQAAPDPRLEPWQWLARDGSLFAALPRMHWALYGGGNAGSANHSVRLHVSLNILEDKPQTAAIEPGKICERKVWRRQWQRGQAYVGDRLFGQDHRVFGQLNALDCVYVLRLREKQTTLQLDEEIPLTNEDQQSGILRQAWAFLGCRQRYRSARVRVVWVKTRENNVLMLATNLPPEKLSAALVWLVYKSRWKVELFFRWIKCILGCRHWLAESANGCAIQLYLALIAAQLLQLHFGRRPNKRMMELIEFHQLGIATDQELQTGLERQLQRMGQRKKV